MADLASLAGSDARSRSSRAKGRRRSKAPTPAWLASEAEASLASLGSARPIRDDGTAETVRTRHARAGGAPPAAERTEREPGSPGLEDDITSRAPQLDFTPANDSGLTAARPGTTEPWIGDGAECFVADASTKAGARRVASAAELSASINGPQLSRLHSAGTCRRRLLTSGPRGLCLLGKRVVVRWSNGQFGAFVPPGFKVVHAANLPGLEEHCVILATKGGEEQGYLGRSGIGMPEPQPIDHPAAKYVFALSLSGAVGVVSVAPSSIVLWRSSHGGPWEECSRVSLGEAATMASLGCVVEARQDAHDDHVLMIPCARQVLLVKVKEAASATPSVSARFAAWGHGVEFACAGRAGLIGCSLSGTYMMHEDGHVSLVLAAPAAGEERHIAAVSVGRDLAILTPKSVVMAEWEAEPEHGEELVQVRGSLKFVRAEGATWPGAGDASSMVWMGTARSLCASATGSTLWFAREDGQAAGVALHPWGADRFISSQARPPVGRTSPSACADDLRNATVLSGGIVALCHGGELHWKDAESGAQRCSPVPGLGDARLVRTTAPAGRLPCHALLLGSLAGALTLQVAGVSAGRDARLVATVDCVALPSRRRSTSLVSCATQLSLAIFALAVAQGRSLLMMLFDARLGTPLAVGKASLHFAPAAIDWAEDGSELVVWQATGDSVSPVCFAVTQSQHGRIAIVRATDEELPRLAGPESQIAVRWIRDIVSAHAAANGGRQGASSSPTAAGTGPNTALGAAVGGEPSLPPSLETASGLDAQGRFRWIVAADSSSIVEEAHGRSWAGPEVPHSAAGALAYRLPSSGRTVVCSREGNRWSVWAPRLASHHGVSVGPGHTVAGTPSAIAAAEPGTRAATPRAGWSGLAGAATWYGDQSATGPRGAAGQSGQAGSALASELLFASRFPRS